MTIVTTKKTRREDDFPLVVGLERLVRPQIDAIESGDSCDLLDRVTQTTAELIKYWFQADFCEVRQANFHVGQREAILNTIYAHEVVGSTTLQGLYEAVGADALLKSGLTTELAETRNQHPKYAAKMATGTGKTWVLNALLMWQHLNHLANPSDPRFTSNFLIVAPGLIVYDRLLDSFQGKSSGGERDFESSDVFRQRELFLPETYRDATLGFIQSSVVDKSEIGRKVTGGGVIAITNWHRLAGVEDPDFLAEGDELEVPGQDIDVSRAVKSMFPVTPGTSAGNQLSGLDRKFERGGPLQSLVDLSSICVFNDEAHHVHQVKRGGEVTDVEWQRSLDEIASTKGAAFIQIDFSATPFDEVGSGKNKRKRFFPHIIVDFDLNDAMDHALVKALALDKRRELAALPLDDLDFKAVRDGNKVVGLSDGQRVMLRAGLQRLSMLEDQFGEIDPAKRPKMMVICEDTQVTKFVEDFLLAEGLDEGEVLRVDSNKKGEISASQWEPVREKLFNIDAHANPKVIVSVLMLREGFDVNNICVVVPLRSSEAGILLEQTVGRGLRLMWRGDQAIDDLKRESRSLIAKGLEPSNYYDVLFIVEHPRFRDWYEKLLTGHEIAEIDDEDDNGRATGDLEVVGLRDDYEPFDFAVPIIVRDADEEMEAPSIDPMTLGVFPTDVDVLIPLIGHGDQFIAEDVQHGTQYGDYRVDGGIMSATGYNDYLSRMAIRISQSTGRTLTSSASKFNRGAAFPVMQAYRPLLVAWLDTFVRRRLFGREFDPFEGENWRVLLLDDVATFIVTAFANPLSELQDNVISENSIVENRMLSEIESIKVRQSSSAVALKCIYPRLSLPSRSGGLEEAFIEMLNDDGRVSAFVKVHEYQHAFLQRPYIKADGMPARYSPDFLVRTASDVYVVETKANSALSDENVKRKQKAALAWCERINGLEANKRRDLEWHYVLLGESVVIDARNKGQRASDLLDYARVRQTVAPAAERLL